jgi:hypothetical protein
MPVPSITVGLLHTSSSSSTDHVGHLIQGLLDRTLWVVKTLVASWSF